MFADAMPIDIRAIFGHPEQKRCATQTGAAQREVAAANLVARCGV